jgi:hypothetical protein
VGGEDREQLIQITEIFYGTGHITSEHIFSTRSRTKGAPGLELEEVGFTPADASFEEHPAPGEGVWKGVHSTFADDKLTFEFSIWKTAMAIAVQPPEESPAVTGSNGRPVAD